jgi:hypothetical protein
MNKTVKFLQIFGIALFVIVAVLSFMFIGYAFALDVYMFSSYPSTMMTGEYKFVLTFILIMVAIVLTVFKAFSQYYFGLFETAVGLGSAWIVMSNSMTNNRVTNAALLLGSLFFLRSGIHDAFEGYPKPHADAEAAGDLFFGYLPKPKT